MNKPRIAACVIAAALASSALTSAAAQSAPPPDGVVIMRRVIAPPKRTPTTQIGEWNVGAWSDASRQCGIVKVTRQVICAKGDRQCTMPPPLAEDEVFGTATECPFRWQVGAYGPISSTCSPTAVRQRNVECVDRSGTVVAAESCEIAYKPDPVEAMTAYESCTYEWQTTPWSGSCRQDAPRTRTAACTMVEYALPADVAMCGTAKPELSQPVSAPDRCDEQWRTGAWSSWNSTCSNSATRSRTVECIDDEGAVTDEARCSASPKPVRADRRRIVDSCPLDGVPADESDLTYSWKTGEFGDLNSSCSPEASRSRAVSCVDSLGRIAGEAKCDGATRPGSIETMPVFTGCAAVWGSGEWGPWSSTCSTDAVRQREVTCLRSDGVRYTAPQDEAACDAAIKPSVNDTGAVYSSCTYRWSAGVYVTPSACGPTTATRTVICQRVGGDGAAVDDTLCKGSERPPATIPATDMRACRYEWSVGEYGDYNSTCSKTATRTRDATCTRINDRQPVDNGLCDGETPPKRSETNEVTTGCTYAWAATPTSEWSQTAMCAPVRTRSQTVACRRSDGELAEDGQCAGVKPTGTETESLPECSYRWNAVYADEVASCGTASALGTVTCQRADGQPAADARCDPAKRPAPSLAYTNYNGCTYGWTTSALGNWDSTCANNASRTAIVSCQRSDGKPASEDQCNPATKPADTVSGINTTECATAFTNLEFETGGAWSTGSTYNWNGGRSGRFMKVSQGSAVYQVPSINLKANSRYRVEFWAKSEFGYGRLYVYLSGALGSVNPLSAISIDGTWTLYTATLEPKSTADVVAPLSLHFFDGRNGFGLDGVKFYAIAP